MSMPGHGDMYPVFLCGKTLRNPLEDSYALNLHQKHTLEAHLACMGLIITWHLGAQPLFLPIFKDDTYCSIAAAMPPVSEQFYEDEDEMDSTGSPSEDETVRGELKVSKFSP